MRKCCDTSNEIFVLLDHRELWAALVLICRYVFNGFGHIQSKMYALASVLLRFFENMESRYFVRGVAQVVFELPMLHGEHKKIKDNVG